MRHRCVLPLLLLSVYLAFPLSSFAAIVAPYQDRSAPVTQAQIEALTTAVRNCMVSYLTL